MSVDVDPGVEDAVDLLVREHGVDGAERELQERFQQPDEQDRACQALAVLRRRESDQV